MSYHGDRLDRYRTPAEVSAVTGALRATGRHVVLVPTMGALHAGHLALVETARRVPGSVVVVSIFVNPLQFGAGEDLDAYPRTLPADLQRLERAGVDVVFVPTVSDMYPNGPRTAVHPGSLGDELEGAVRTGHFAGMLTVVAKLLAIVRPRTVVLGEKDYQQLTLVRQMVTDLDTGVRVLGVPTVREPDGLALSSRNVNLDPGQRRAAVALSAAMAAGTVAARRGGEAVLSTARAVLAAEASLRVDYLELRDPALRPAPRTGPARLLVAARLGRTRLLDNAGLDLEAPSPS